MARVKIEVDGVRHIYSASARKESCKDCSLRPQCEPEFNVPCCAFGSTNGIFQKDNTDDMKSHVMLLAIYEYTRNMRRKQRLYFSTRDKVVLDQAKELESKVDASIRDLEAYWDEQLEGI